MDYTLGSASDTSS